jgi:hypothetical protein
MKDSWAFSRSSVISTWSAGIKVFPNLLTTVVDFDDYAYRNISTVLPSEDLLDDLSDDPADRTYGEALVSRSRDDPDYDSIIDRPFRYGQTIEPRMCPGMRTRFSDGTRFGAWYGSLSILTTVYETLYHRQRFLDDARIQSLPGAPVISHRRVFRLRVTGILIDLRGKEYDFPELVSGTDYRFCHRVGDYLYQSGQKGFLVRSARDAKGTNVVAFSPSVLFDPRHQLYILYSFDGNGIHVSLDTEEPRKWVAMEDIRSLFHEE